MTEKQLSYEKRWELFRKVWKKLKRKNCQQCGVYLGSTIKSYFFDHLIERSKRPDLELEEKNIFICCGNCHTNKTNGNPGEIHRKAIENVKVLLK